MSRVIGIVPARMASSRFPGKPLAMIAHNTMLWHVCRAAGNPAAGLTDMAVATCDHVIADHVNEMFRDQGVDDMVVMTSPSHTRALDRVAEAAAKLGAKADDIIVNIQADEPMVAPEDIVKVARVVAAEVDRAHEFSDVTAIHFRFEAAMLCRPLLTRDEMTNPDNVKVVIRQCDGDVLYTSRAPVPYRDPKEAQTGGWTVIGWRVAGVFAFRYGALAEFSSMSPTMLELRESCDVNRWLDNGKRLRAVPVPWRPAYSVDRPEDIARVEAAMKMAA